jgi:outer membrane lipase/esterase
MTMTTVRASALVVALTLAGTTQVFGQSTPPSPPLAQFVNNSETATTLQRTTGIAVQGLCGHLGSREPSPGFQLPPGSAKLDAYLRCNELVQTASQINTGQSTRSLNLNSDQLLGALQQVAGEELSSQGALTTRVSSGQFANISGRLNALRFGTQSATARGRTALLEPQSKPAVVAYQGDRVIDPDAFQYDSLGGNLIKTNWAADPQATGDASGREGASTGIQQKWGWFSEGSYGFGDHDQTPGEDGFDFDSVSGTIGLDYNLGGAVVGVSAGYDRYKADFDTNSVVSGGDLEVTGGSGSVFAAWFGNRVTVDAIATYGSLSSDITRRLQIPSNNPGGCVPACPAQDRTYLGSPDGDYIAAGVSAGFEFDAANWDFALSVAGNYRDISIDSYAETESVTNGGLALAYGEQTVESFRSIVGFSASRAFSQNFGIVMPTFRAEWHHEFKDDPRTIQAQYALEPTLTNKASACVSCFALQSDAPESDFGIVGAGLSLTFARRMQLFMYYETLLGVSDYKSNSISLGFRGQF